MFCNKREGENELIIFDNMMMNLWYLFSFFVISFYLKCQQRQGFE